MKLKYPVWIALTDGLKARLIRAGLTSNNRPHVEDVDRIIWTAAENAGPNAPPSPLRAKDNRSYASPGHFENEILDRCAREAVRWLHERMAEHAIERLVVFAPKRFIGALRFTHALPDNVLLRPGELTRLLAGELAGHQEILELLGQVPVR